MANPTTKQEAKPNTQFKWFEIFRAGKHTDSKGNEAEFSQSDLQSVLSSFAPKTAPLVIGHPKTDDPAWGWASELKIENDTLYAKAEEVSADFAEAVENKRYPNRSVRLTKTDDGYRLAHIGFLGGKPPAVDGLAWQFNEAEDQAAVEFEFAASERIESVALDTSNVLLNLINNLKTFITDRFGADEARKVVPEYDAEWLNEQAILARHEKHTENAANNQISAEFSAHSNQDEDNTVTEEEKKALEAKLAASEAANATLQFNQRKFDAQTFIDTKVNGGKAPRLTNTEGIAEFMAHLESGEAQTFEFAAADGEQNKTVAPGEWFKGFLEALPEQKGLTAEFSQDDGNENDIDNSAEALAAKAIDFQKSLAEKGITVSISSALEQVQKEAS